MNARRKVFNPEPEAAIQLKSHKHCFSKECTQELEFFASLHKYDDRKTFKEAWQKWCEANNELINNESKQCCRTDIIKKMFVSVRYYYKKKSDAKKEKTSSKIRIIGPTVSCYYGQTFVFNYMPERK